MCLRQMKWFLLYLAHRYEAYPCPRSAKPAVILAHPRRQSLRPFFCRSKQDINRIARPASPVSRASRYNTLHLASKVVCQRGHKPPLETPGFVSAWPQIAFLHLCPHPIQNLKKRRRSAYEWWAGLRHFFIRPVGRNETRCIWRIVFPG